MIRDFKAEYADLNEAQRQAVDYTDGPLLVVAGPGTGKTQLLSLRVANILRTTDTKPANILCLTYTNKAAINMKQRIIKLAGSESAKLPVKTFHSFAGEIMNTYPEHFWNAARLTVAPESVQIEIIESIISDLAHDNPLSLKFAGQYTLIKDIKQAIGLAKDAGLTPDKLRAIIEINLAYIDIIEADLTELLDDRLSFKHLPELLTKVQALPSQPIDANVYPLTSLSTALVDGLSSAVDLDIELGRTTNTGAWKKRWLQSEAGQKGMFAERRRNHWWLELAGVYESYLNQMHERGFYDYSDMLVEVITKLEQSEELLADLQEHYNYVLIDEFQDTTLAQLRLAHLVADHYAAEGNPNLMVVGDDDQTIFKFSGAELNNMLGFKRHYPKAKIIVLTKNYRSTQAVLDVAKLVIEQAENRLVKQNKALDKNLIAVNPPADKGSIKALSYSSRELQYSQIARDIKQNYRADREMVVLARGHDSLLRLANILNGLNVPIRYEYQSNIFEHDLIQQIYLLSKLLLAIQAGDKAQCNSTIHEIIRHPMWQIEPQVLWQMAVDNFRATDWLDTLITNQNDHLAKLGQWFVWLAAEATNQPLAITLEHLLGLRQSDFYCSPVNDYYLKQRASLAKAYFQSLSAIQLLRSLVHEFSKKSQPVLDDLVRFIDINRTNGLVVADESPFITGDHAVQLMTVYKAKGLEFDNVYIVDAVEDIWQPRTGKRQPPANLPLQPAGDDLDDYVRLMYVALTRAKSTITVSSYYLNHAGKDVATSPIIHSAFDVAPVNETDQSVLTEVLHENLRWPDLQAGQASAILKARLESYSLSVTHLLNFLDIKNGGPEYFKQRNLLMLPEAKSATLAYGTAMHAAMETAQRLINTDNFTIDKVHTDYQQALAEQQLTKSDFQRYLSRGQQTLTKLFTDYQYQLVKGSLPEQNLNDVRLGSARIRGKLDRLDFNDQQLTIVDYKTGNPLSSFDTTAKSLAVKAHKHKLQLIFYALLTSQHPSYSQYQAITGQMVYLEADSAGQLIRHYTPTIEDIDRLKRLIQAVYQRIINLDFPDISSYSSDLDGLVAFENELIK